MIPTASSQRHDGFAKVLLRCSEADSAATKTVYERYQPQLVRLARDLGAEDPEGSADLAFFDGLQAIENLHSRSELAFRSYLYTATRNRVVSEHRKGTVETTPFDVKHETYNETAVENEVVDSVFLKTVLRDLTTDQRDVIVHRFFGGYTSEETAKRLGKSSSAVRRLQHTGLKSLRRAFVAAGLIALVVVAALLWRGQPGEQRIDIGPVAESPNRPAVDRLEPIERPSTTETPVPGSAEARTRLTSGSPLEGSQTPGSRTTFVEAPTGRTNQTIVSPSLDAHLPATSSPSSTGSVAAPQTPTSTASSTGSVAASTTTSTSVTSPLAVADVVEIEDDKDEKIEVLDNDSARGAPLDEDTLEIVTPPAHADKYRVHDDHIHFKSIKDFEGIDTLTYRICDTAKQCSTATVTIIVEED
ncbi:MAG: sigma-70 family RNA polymerase sigma factor [Acidimicrobiales bacterium]